MAEAKPPTGPTPPDPRPRVLLAEDDPALRRIVSGLLSDAGFEPLVAEDGQQALERFEEALAAGEPPAAVVSDIEMPGLDGLALIDRLKLLDPEVAVVFITAYSSVDSAVAALRKGAFDYVTKPFQNERLVQIVRNAARQRGLAAENRTLRHELTRTFALTEIVSRSPGMERVLRVVERAAPTAASVLIRGETGTGKELVARALHHASPRAPRPFVSVNCAALPEGLLESELFGHEKGAFTGAVARSQGLFRAAHGGTLFLDEVGELSPGTQAKLLRVLETREVRPVGATATVTVDVRLVAATHRDLLTLEGFREDLFYRLAVIELEVPSLRSRPDDVPLLARHLLARLARDRNEPERRLHPDALDLLTRHPWPGNVRELRNALEHALTLGGDVITPTDLPPRVRAGAETGLAPPEPHPTDAPSPLTLAQVERRHVEATLRQCNDDRREAAARLGIDLSTLYRKLKRWHDEAALQ